MHNERGERSPQTGIQEDVATLITFAFDVIAKSQGGAQRNLGQI